MNIRQGFSLLLFSAIHFVLIIPIILNSTTNLGVRLGLIAILPLLILGYIIAPKSHGAHAKIETLLYPFIIALAAVLTFYLSIDLSLGPVIASAGLGFVASYFPSIFKSSFLKSLPTPIYCGSFVGMCGTFLTEDYLFISYAGLVSGILFILTRDTLNGVGGKLGTIAFGGVVVVSFIFGLL